MKSTRPTIRLWSSTPATSRPKTSSKLRKELEGPATAGPFSLTARAGIVPESSRNGAMASTILEMRDITKTFPGVRALANVNLAVEEGEIHAVVGENGAGKSTLMKVLSGVYPYGDYEGKIIYRGQECQFKGIH